MNNPNCLLKRQIYHTTPLHYLPNILRCGELMSQSNLGYTFGRRTARRRDRLLQVDKYVHFSLKPRTPMLLHKLDLGYPHVVLQFDLPEQLSKPMAILPCSTKAWRSVWQCQPVEDDLEIDRLLRQYDSGKRFQGLEVLISERMSLSSLTRIIVVTEAEAEIVSQLCTDLPEFQQVQVKLDMTLYRQKYEPKNMDVVAEYYRHIKTGNFAVPMPTLPFD